LLAGRRRSSDKIEYRTTVGDIEFVCTCLGWPAPRLILLHVHGKRPYIGQANWGPATFSSTSFPPTLMFALGPLTVRCTRISRGHNSGTELNTLNLNIQFYALLWTRLLAGSFIMYYGTSLHGLAGQCMDVPHSHSYLLRPLFLSALLHSSTCSTPPSLSSSSASSSNN
jgi:hypothetical protein